MLQAMKYWVEASGLVEIQPGNKNVPTSSAITELGNLILKNDPYFEDIASTWLVHIGICSNKNLATLWYWMFNKFHLREFNEQRVTEGITEYCAENEWGFISENSMRKDIRCFFRTYLASGKTNQKTQIDDRLDSPLVSLGLLRNSTSTGQYRFRVGKPRSLPVQIFEYQLLLYKASIKSQDVLDKTPVEATNEIEEEVVVSLEDLRWAPMSPGRILGLDMSTILDMVEELSLKPDANVMLSRTAGLNTVTINYQNEPIDIIKKYYTDPMVEIA